eukprot:13200939-Alexandrium_andersonii.AAC.1
MHCPAPRLLAWPLAASIPDVRRCQPAAGRCARAWARAGASWGADGSTTQQPRAKCAAREAHLPQH